MFDRATAAYPNRRRSSNDPPRKTGWQVRTSVAEAVKQAVEAGAADSQNAFVEQAIVRELAELRRRRVYDAYAAAAQDPAFRSEMKDITAQFDAATGDGVKPGE